MKPMLERLHGWLTRPFYGPLSCAYDCGAFLVSGGLWKRWTFTAEQFVAGHPVLEVGCGRGHLLQRLAKSGLDVVGLDLSHRMADAARDRLRKAGLLGTVVCADARQMPFSDASIGTVINTFPTAYVEERATWLEYLRVLRPGGRGVFVETPLLDGFDLRLAGVCLAVLSKYGSLAPIRSISETGIPTELFPRQRKEVVQVAGTRVVVAILEKAQ